MGFLHCFCEQLPTLPWIAQRRHPGIRDNPCDSVTGVHYHCTYKQFYALSVAWDSFSCTICRLSGICDWASLHLIKSIIGSLRVLYKLQTSNSISFHTKPSVPSFSIHHKESGRPVALWHILQRSFLAWSPLHFASGLSILHLHSNRCYA